MAMWVQIYKQSLRGMAKQGPLTRSVLHGKAVLCSFHLSQPTLLRESLASRVNCLPLSNQSRATVSSLASSLTNQSDSILTTKDRASGPITLGDHGALICMKTDPSGTGAGPLL